MQPTISPTIVCILVQSDANTISVLVMRTLWVALSNTFFSATSYNSLSFAKWYWIVHFEIVSKTALKINKIL